MKRTDFRVATEQKSGIREYPFALGMQEVGDAKGGRYGAFDTRFFRIEGLSNRAEARRWNFAPSTVAKI